MAQDLFGLLDGVTVLSKDGAGESVRGGLVAEVQRLFVLGIGIDVNGDDGSEDLLPSGSSIPTVSSNSLRSRAMRITKQSWGDLQNFNKKLYICPV